jgi:hypothetical protein
MPHGKVSSNGASMWWWTRDTRQILYTTPDVRELWRVDIEPVGTGLRIGTPQRLGTLPPGLVTNSIDATPDRQRFLALVPDQIGVPSLTVVQHWQAALNKK